MHKLSGWNQTVYDEATVKAALAAAGIDIVAEVPSDFIIFCPYHNNFRTPAGEVSKETGVFYCFACNTATSLIQLVSKVTNKTYFQAARLIGGTLADVSDIVERMEPKDEFVEYPQGEVDRLHADVKHAIPYLNGRGIYDVHTFEIGYSAVRNMVTIPMHTDAGLLVGFQGRSIEGKSFNNTPDLPKRKIVFNLHRVRMSQHVFVLESAFDVIRCHQLGIPAVSTLGSGVTKEQIELLFRYFPTVYVSPDRDEAGKKMASVLMDKGAILRVVPEGYNDIGDLTDDQIKELLTTDILAGIL